MNHVLRVVWIFVLAILSPAAALASVSVSLTPTTVHVQPNGQMQFAATVSGTSNSVVIWSLAGTACGGNACGQITNGGLYLAPAVAPKSNVVTVTATSLADLSASASASVILGVSSDITVSVLPAQATVLVSQQQRFLALVSGTTITRVGWKLTGTGCTGSSCGTLTTDGLYTAPISVPTPPQVTITATAVADPSMSASALVTIIPPVAISISPAVVQVAAGTKRSFTAMVTGSQNTAVSWTIRGSGCSDGGCGTITANGLYTAPTIVPSPPQISVTATSVADPTKSATASVTVIPPVAVTISPETARLVTGSHQQFTATVTGASNTAVSWSIAGSGCSGAGCGTISASGLYTAPTTVPSPSQVAVTATSVADPTKFVTASITIIPLVSVTISPTTVQLLTGGHQQFTATVTGTSNTGISWSIAGSGCTGATCGSISTSGLYTAPSAVPSPAQVSVTATSTADPTKSATASVTITPPVSVTVSPTTAQLLTGSHQQFAATVTGASNTAVQWSVSGSGCSGAACGTISTTGLYTAPANVPAPNLVKITATSVADSAKSGSAMVTITGPVSVSISPVSVQVVVGGSQQFSATVTGISNTKVSWSVAGSGCSGAACGTISLAGLYFAPAAVPSPAQIFVTATSVADATKSSTATVTIIPPIVVTLSPLTATVTTGGHQQFTAKASGSTNTGIVWSVSGSGCSGAACGSITATGLYTAPATVPSPAQVTVKAASAFAPNSYRTATVTIIRPVAVSISPTTAAVVAGNARQFIATVTGTTNHNVTWSVTGKGCSGVACGTITATGLYGAPGSVPNPAEVTVTATSVVDPSKSSNATVTILPPVAVTISPATVQVVRGGRQQFIATVTGTTNAGVAWSVSGSGCSGNACGTISSAGLYRAPGTIPNPARVTVKATSQADSTKSATAAVTIILPVVVAISPASAVVAVNGQQQFRASVTGSTNQAVDWSISGAACSGSTCGSITSEGLYTAPSIVPSIATIIVKASSQIDVSQSASAIVTVVANPNSRLQGQYAFRFSGFDASGAYLAAGSFTADGNGNVVSGREDVNHAVGTAGEIAFTGKYQVHADNRCTLTLVNSAATQTFSLTLNSAGTSGRFIEFDDSGVRGSGVLEQQDSGGFTLASLKGPYVLSLTGKNNAAARIGTLALLDFDGSGNVVGGSMDVNNGGSVLPTFASLHGIYRVDAAGRGIVNLSIPGFGSGTMALAFYVVSADKLLLVSTNLLSSDNPIFGGTAELQSGAPYLTSDLHGATAFSLSGESGNLPQVLVGRITFDGVSQPLVEFDQNTGGAVVTGNVLTGAYSLGLNGSGTLNLDDSNGLVKVWDLYAIAPNHAYLMDVSSSEVGMGELKAQSNEPVFASRDIAGPYLFGSGEMQVQGATLYSGIAEFDGINVVTGVEDISRTSSMLAAQSLKGSYSVSSSLNNGRGMLVLTSPTGATIALWVTSTSEVLGLEVDSSNPQPLVLHFEQ